VTPEDAAHPARATPPAGTHQPREARPMSKEKNKGNKEAKKPKKEKPKVLATANSNVGKNDTTIAGKKVR
jgi:hypothetical protein